MNNSLASVLGFNKGEYTYVERREDPTDPDKVTSYTDYYESENLVRIDEVSSSESQTILSEIVLL